MFVGFRCCCVCVVACCCFIFDCRVGLRSVRVLGVVWGWLLLLFGLWLPLVLYGWWLDWYVGGFCLFGVLFDC